MSNQRGLLLLLAAFVLATLPRVVAAQEGAEAKNAMEVFLGAATKFEQSDDTETNFAMGLAYLRRVSPLFSVGGLVELTSGDVRDAIIMAPVLLHAYRGLFFLAAPGLEVDGGEETIFIMRLGTGYELELPMFSLSPEFNMDFTEDEVTLVYGVSMGFPF